jgi:hypothetical protein
LQVDITFHHVSLVILRTLWLRVLVGHWRKFAHAFTGVPNLEYDIENIPVDLPGCASENVKTCVNKLHVAQCRRVLKV